MLNFIIRWVISLFVRGVDERKVVSEQVIYDELVVEVNFLHPSRPFVPREEPAPKPKPQAQKIVTSEEIHSWLSSVREYDSVRATLWT